jgi:hypothetical protein
LRQIVRAVEAAEEGTEVAMNEDSFKGLMLVWGFVLIITGGSILLQAWVVPEVADLRWTVLFLAAGAAFFAVYLYDRGHWWAAIPGGALFTLALLILPWFRADKRVSFFFIGLAATFGLVGLRRTAERRISWRLLLPAIALFVAGAWAYTPGVGAVVLIVVGV